MNWFENLSPVIQTLIITTFTWAMTALGALLVCFFKKINQKVLDMVLGFSAGVMIAASFWSLINPAIELSYELGYIEWLLPAIGFIVGGLFVLVSDKLLDKILNGKEEIEKKASLKRSIMLICAITIHNIPEGMAIGVAFGGIISGTSGLTTVAAVMLGLGIGIQNLPEGAAVSLPLRREGFSRWKSFIIGQASALVEPISAVIGVILVMYIKNILPFLLAFAAGAMIIVTARELLPESVKYNKNLSTLGLITGFVVMMVLDVALG